jgi:hypothetical protein
MFAKYAPQSGFALLVSLVVVGVVLSVGMVLLDLTIKQVELATTTRNSEIAFHAANAGMECAQYVRRANPTLNSTIPGSITPECFGASALANTRTENAALDIYEYDYQFTWGSSGSERCSLIRMVVANPEVSDIDVNDILISNASFQTVIPGYPDGQAFECSEGSQCTTISVKGYNRPCPQINNFGVVEREVLLEF